MADTSTTIPPTRRVGVPPMGVEPPVREPARVSAREPARYFTPPEAHEKYEIPASEMDPTRDYFWAPTRVAGQPNDKIGQYYRAGWEPEMASNFPRLSGYGTEFPQKMIDLGLLKNVDANDPVLLDDLMLVSRPKELSKAARERDKARAHDQVANQMKRLQQAYRPMRDGGVSRRHRPLADSEVFAQEE